jgi:hypothetical protein
MQQPSKQDDGDIGIKHARAVDGMIITSLIIIGHH